MASPGRTPFHRAFPRASHPRTRSLTVTRRDRPRRHFTDGSPAAPPPTLPSHHLSDPGLGLGPPQPSLSLLAPAEERCCFPRHSRKGHNRGQRVWLMGKPGSMRWVSPAHGEGRATDGMLATPHLTQLPPRASQKRNQGVFLCTKQNETKTAFAPNKRDRFRLSGARGTGAQGCRHVREERARV